MCRAIIAGCLLLILSSCLHYSATEPCVSSQESDCYLEILVDARHFDYTDGQRFINTMQRSPNFGHAWIYLKRGDQVFEGGHSGELGVKKATYFDGIMNNIEYGAANPTAEQLRDPSYEPNPVKYLWEKQDDGFLQKASGGHRPTYAVRINLSDEQYAKIVSFVKRYDFSDYSLIGNQCASFAAGVAAAAGLQLDAKVTLSINQKVKVFGEWFSLWQDPAYSKITLSTPDKLEESMKAAVKSGVARHIPCSKNFMKVQL